MTAYHHQTELERRIDAAAAAMHDGIVDCDAPVTPEVVERAKRWLAWMVDVAYSTSCRWVEPSEVERTCDNEIAFLWTKDGRRLYVAVGRSVEFFWFEDHSLWGSAESGDGSDPAGMQACWSYFWR